MFNKSGYVKGWDYVNWFFFKKVLHRLSFNEKLINKVMDLIGESHTPICVFECNVFFKNDRISSEKLLTVLKLKELA